MCEPSQPSLMSIHNLSVYVLGTQKKLILFLRSLSKHVFFTSHDCLFSFLLDAALFGLERKEVFNNSSLN